MALTQIFETGTLQYWRVSVTSNCSSCLISYSWRVGFAYHLPDIPTAESES